MNSSGHSRGGSTRILSPPYATRPINSANWLRAAVKGTVSALIAGPSPGGLLYGLGQVVPFVGQLLAYFFSFLAILMIRTPMDVRRREGRGEERGSLFQDIVEGFRWTWDQRLLRVMLLAAAGISLVFSALTFGVIAIAKQGGATSAEVGLMPGIAGVADAAHFTT